MFLDRQMMLFWFPDDSDSDSDFEPPGTSGKRKSRRPAGSPPVRKQRKEMSLRSMLQTAPETPLVTIQDSSESEEFIDGYGFEENEGFEVNDKGHQQEVQAAGNFRNISFPAD